MFWMSTASPCTNTIARVCGRVIRYAGILRTCLAAPSCKSFETWGFTDAHTWLGEKTAPLPFDADYKPKPAFDAMINVLLNKTLV